MSEYLDGKKQGYCNGLRDAIKLISRVYGPRSEGERRLRELFQTVKDGRYRPKFRYPVDRPIGPNIK